MTQPTDDELKAALDAATVRVQARVTAKAYEQMIATVMDEYTSKSALRQIARDALVHLVVLHRAFGEEPAPEPAPSLIERPSGLIVPA